MTRTVHSLTPLGRNSHTASLPSPGMNFGHPCTRTEMMAHPARFELTTSAFGGHSTGLFSGFPVFTRDAQHDRTLVKEADPGVVEEWKVHLRPSRAAAAKLAKPLGDVTLDPYAHEISGLRVQRDAARAPQCGLQTQ